jgi:hypothetical protein
MTLNPTTVALKHPNMEFNPIADDLEPDGGHVNHPNVELNPMAARLELSSRPDSTRRRAPSTPPLPRF